MQSNDWRMDVYLKMKKHKVTQKEIAQEIHYTEAQFSKIMSGKVEPKIMPETILYAIDKIAERKGVLKNAEAETDKR